MLEAVRLVVWDLDETFWKGTLTEGGIREYVDAHHDIVIELARRGIISSICSKNDPEPVVRILQEKGIIDYFVCPSISWEPKGLRLAQLIETLGLRPATAMFVDDNPNNRAEALAIVPGVQVEDENFIASMLDDFRFQGKDDSELSRLRQYKLLEQRKSDEKDSKGGNEEFLYSCDVRVYIEYNVDAHIDRAVELINRTNQLNYTKKRLSENINIARATLREQMRAFDRTVGLIKVVDKYGDYGFVGFFMAGMMRQKVEPGCSNTHLVHFCFSCRTLGMLVEQWAYNYLGRPELQVVGEVLTDLRVPKAVGWIRLIERPDIAGQSHPEIAPGIVFCGGCEANAVAVYLQPYTPNLSVFGNYVANGVFVSVNYVDRWLDVCERQGGEILDELKLLGLPKDLESGDIFRHADFGTVYVVNFSMDAAGGARLRHSIQDWLFVLSPNGLGTRELYEIEEDSLRALLDSDKARVPPECRDHVVSVSRHLKASYELSYRPPEIEIVRRMKLFIGNIPEGSKLVIVIDHHQRREHQQVDRIVDLPEVLSYRSAMIGLAKEFEFVGVVQIADSILAPEQLFEGNHYDRSVYFRVAQDILSAVGTIKPRRDRPLARRRMQRLLEEERIQSRYASEVTEFVNASYEALLRRKPEPGLVDKLAKAFAAHSASFSGHIRGLANSKEFASKWQAITSTGIEQKPTLISPALLRTPVDLCVTATTPQRILIVGSCLSEGLAMRLRSMTSPCESDLYFVGSVLPESPTNPVANYDFQIVQLALRHILPDASFARIAHADEVEHEKLFGRAAVVMNKHLEQAMRWNKERGLLTFVFPFVVPTQNPVGRLLPKHELRNAVYFIDRLNQLMAAQLDTYSNAFLTDINEIYGFYGRRFVQDDILTTFNHGNVFSNYDAKHDVGRLEITGPALDYFEERALESFSAVWNEILALYRTVRQIDQVKMVVVDLDDTMWRGVIGDADLDNLPTSEGWPKGFWEALLILKRRGILLSILSKNEESRVDLAWDQIFRKQLQREDFVARMINWLPKPQNMQAVLTAVNLLPQNVLYIDDNPVERAAMKEAFPGLRTLGGAPFLWRRILLWAPETQVAAITAESAVKTEMVRAQVSREEQRKLVSHEDFLASLEVTISLESISDTNHTRFQRCLELVNKTNQFNTTGQRWTHEKFKSHFESGQRLVAFQVSDKYTDYGLVSVLVLREYCIDQFVMSCRVLGLGIEAAVISLVGVALIQKGAKLIYATMIETERNRPCWEVFAQSGFERTGDNWIRSAEHWPPCPSHITVRCDAAFSQKNTEAVG